MRRPSFAEKIIETFSIKSVDPFKQNWQKSNGKTIAHSEAWGYENKYGGGASNSGIRLVCTREFLREVLTTLDSDLLVLVKLQRYEEGSKLFDSKFSHTIAVLQIKKSLDIEYHKGAVNRIHKINNNLDS